VHCETAVIAAGAWSSDISGLPSFPIGAVKGQAVMARRRPRMFRHHIYASPGYIVPRADGRMILGVTYEKNIWDKTVTVGGLTDVFTACCRISRSLRECEIVKYWAGLRPRAMDGRPLLGHSSALKGLVFACGHFGLGITLAPITASLIAESIMADTSGHIPNQYSPDRFAT
jgi:glycine oxidase